MSKYKRLIVFDFDGTLCHTPDQEQGEKVWFEHTGTKWPYTGWWGKSETIDMDIFHVPVNQWVYQKYLEATSDEDAYVILATGRLEKVAGMRKNVERILNYHNLSFDGVHLNNIGDTFRFKRSLFENLADELGVDEVVMYDDRHEHLVKFWEWAAKKPFKVDVVDVVHKTTKTF